MGLQAVQRRAMIARYHSSLKRAQSPAAPTEVGSLKAKTEIKNNFTIQAEYQGFNKKAGSHEFSTQTKDEILQGELLFNGGVEKNQQFILLQPTNTALNPAYSAKVF